MSFLLKQPRLHESPVLQPQSHLLPADLTNLSFPDCPHWPHGPRPGAFAHAVPLHTPPQTSILAGSGHRPEAASPESLTTPSGETPSSQSTSLGSKLQTQQPAQCW